MTAQGSAFLVKNINTRPDPNASSVSTERWERFSNALVVGDIGYFIAYDREHGRELWKTNGTPAGTVLVADVNPGPGDGIVSDPTVAAGAVFFLGRDATHGQELWKTDGTAKGTVLVKDINPQGDGARGSLTASGSYLFFIADDGRRASLWRTDGTAAGTVALVEAMYYPQLVDVDGRLFLLQGAPYTDLWVTDGTPAGTKHVTNLGRVGCESKQFGENLTAADGRIYFLAGSLCTSDGTAAGTMCLTKECPYLPQIEMNGILFFLGDEAETGAELWRTDGTIEGTWLVKDINPGPADGFYNDFGEDYSAGFTDVNGTLFFFATDGVSGFELWKSDGTEAGTVMVKDTVPGPMGLTTCSLLEGPSVFDDCEPTLIATDDALLFTGVDIDHGHELWRSDGTAEGTAFVADLRPGPSWFELGASIDFGGALYFLDWWFGALWRTDGTTEGTVMVADGEFHNPVVLGQSIFMLGVDVRASIEPWVSDGTEEGTHLLKDIFRGDAGSAPEHLTDVDGTLFFTADNGTHGRELWRSDGSAMRTNGVLDIRPGAEGSSPTELTPVGNTLFFVADDGVHGAEPWRSDGTREGTFLIADVNPGPHGSMPLELTRVGDAVFFRADDGVHGMELWRSNGTAAGTTLVSDSIPGPIGSLTHYWGHQLTDLNGTLLFVGNDGTAEPEHPNFELWRSDGTAEGTRPVREIVPGPASSHPEELTVIGETAYFTIRVSEQYGLWKTDGTEDGTTLVAGLDSSAHNLLAFGDDVFFVQGGWGDSVRRLWRTDGIESGTSPVVDIPSRSEQFTTTTGAIYFVEGTFWATKLWRTEGTAETTRVAFDFDPHQSNWTRSLTLSPVGERLALQLNVDPGYRSDDPPLTLWRSDGSETGTVLLQDISPAADAPDFGFYDEVLALTRSGSHLFFVSRHGGNGRELWALPISALNQAPPTPTPTATAIPEHGGDGGCNIDPASQSSWPVSLASLFLPAMRHRSKERKVTSAPTRCASL